MLRLFRFISGVMLSCFIAFGQEATVVVTGTIDPSLLAMGDWRFLSGCGSDKYATNQAEAFGTEGGNPGGGGGSCVHTAKGEITSGCVGQNWCNEHDGKQIFFNKFSNKTSISQTFSEMVSSTIKTSFEGSITLAAACAKVGVDMEVKISRTFPIVVPSNSVVSMSAKALMMDKSIEFLLVCISCREVLAVYNKPVTAAMGVSGYFLEEPI